MSSLHLNSILEVSSEIQGDASYGHLNSSSNENDKLGTSKLIVICGPSGSGKSTIIRRLISEFNNGDKNKIILSVSHTSRSPRPGEQHGVDYFFTDRATMEKEIATGRFLEYTEYCGNLYGTHLETVQNILSTKDKIYILDLDQEGVKKIKLSPLMQSNASTHFIFICPPSLEQQEAYLRGRGTESEEAIQARLARAQQDLDYGKKPGNFDLVIVNDNLENAYQQFKSYVLKNCSS